ncbi:hypothetical protein Goshw_015581 [Gossypium schwendimanii]|uniref:Uncharacterized protein n=1 Tax=Gossypium schwendimanii TaxID=34291 RepID=A0A7J9MUD0_GOSSC|nr:hypothetical protein [Gossypium schwendimanii]
MICFSRRNCTRPSWELDLWL